MVLSYRRHVLDLQRLRRRSCRATLNRRRHRRLGFHGGLPQARQPRAHQLRGGRPVVGSRGEGEAGQARGAAVVVGGSGGLAIGRLSRGGSFCRGNEEQKDSNRVQSERSLGRVDGDKGKTRVY